VETVVLRVVRDGVGDLPAPSREPGLAGHAVVTKGQHAVALEASTSARMRSATSSASAAPVSISTRTNSSPPATFPSPLPCQRRSIDRLLVRM